MASNDIQVGIHQVGKGTEGGPRLYAEGITTGIGLAVTGTYYKPNPDDAPPRYDRFLLHAGDMFLEDDLQKLEEQVQIARQAGLLGVEVHVLAPEPFSFQRPAVEAQAAVVPAAHSSNEVFLNAYHNSVKEQVHIALESTLLGPAARNPIQASPSEAQTGPPAPSQWEDNTVRAAIDAQKQLWERLLTMVRGGVVRWYKYPVCHHTDVYRWSHTIALSGNKTVSCRSDDLNRRTNIVRAIQPIQDDKEEYEDSGLRCC